jgi:8-oxo-dGTP pyrophosphatase MutT (NUDIX family)
VGEIVRTTVRAVIINSTGQVFLVQHNEHNPSDLGKWATVGGGLEEFDADYETCLKREIAEEFGEESLNNITVIEKLFVNRQSYREDHFYMVFFSGDNLEPVAGPEILNFKWFELNAISKLPFFFGFEPDLCQLAVQRWLACRR